MDRLAKRENKRIRGL